MKQWQWLRIPLVLEQAGVGLEIGDPLVSSLFHLFYWVSLLSP